jgi:F-type H+-transporting ATPase subunit a
MIFTAKPSVHKAFRQILPAIVTVFSLMFSVAGHASDDAEGKFKPGEMIMHHISDAHSIHMWGHTSIPLPVILYTDKGLDIFMSSNFWDEHHNMVPYTSPKTGYTYENHHEKIVIVEPGAAHTHVADTLSADTLHAEDPAVHAEADHGHEAASHGSLIDFSITKSVFGMMFILALLVFVFLRVAKAYKKKGAPKGLQNVMEALVLFIRDEVAIPSLGKKRAKKFLPLMLTLFFFIWGCNLLGLIPFLGGFNITGTLSITLVLATIVFIVTSVNGNGHYWGHIFWPPGVPFFVKLILVPIEIASVFIKPAVLMIRLTANITAGHIVILAFVSLVILFGANGMIAGYSVGVGASLFMIFMFFIELLVSFLQAYVFVLLTALYLSDATQEHHHEDHH